MIKKAKREAATKDKLDAAVEKNEKICQQSLAVLQVTGPAHLAILAGAKRGYQTSMQLSAAYNQAMLTAAAALGLPAPASVLAPARAAVSAPAPAAVSAPAAEECPMEE